MNCNTNLLNGDGVFGVFCNRYVLKTTSFSAFKS